MPGNGGGGTGEPKFEGNDIDGWKERSGGVGLEGARRDPADAVELRYAAGLDGAGPIETFLAEGKKLPVVLLTCNRATLLSETIKVGVLFLLARCGDREKVYWYTGTIYWYLYYGLELSG